MKRQKRFNPDDDFYVITKQQKIEVNGKTHTVTIHQQKRFAPTIQPNRRITLKRR